MINTGNVISSGLQRQALSLRPFLPLRKGLDPRQTLGERPFTLLQQWQVIRPEAADRIELLHFHAQLQTTQGVLAFNEAGFPIEKLTQQDTFSMVLAVCRLLCGDEIIEALLKKSTELPSECFIG